MRFLERFSPTLIFFLAVILRLGYLIESEGSPLFDVFLVDADYYDQMARRILNGDWLAGNKVFTMSPLYPYFLAFLYKIFAGNIFWVKAVQHLIGAGACALLCRIGILLSGPVAGLTAGFFAAVYGLFIFSEGTLENEFLVIFFNVLAMRFLLLAFQRQTPGCVLAGLCIGVSAGIRPNAVLLIIPALLWIRQQNPDGRRAIFMAAALAASVMLPLMGIALRNYSVSGDWVWATSTGGQLVYIGTLDGGGGYVLPDFVTPEAGQEHKDFEDETARRMGRPVRSGEVSGYWIHEAWLGIISAPGSYLKLVGKKFLAFCGGGEPPDNYDYEFNRRYSRLLSAPLAGFALVFPLAVLGLAVATQPLRQWTLPVGFLGAYLFSVLLFYQSYRFRLPAMPSLMLLAGASAAWIVSRVVARQWRALVMAAVVLLGAGLVTLNPFPPADRDVDFAIAANNYYRLIGRKGRVDEAETFLLDVLKKQPDYAKNLGKIAYELMARGKYAKAIEMYGQILRDQRYIKAGYQNMAICHLQLNRPAEALVALNECLRNGSDDADVHYLIGDAESMLGPSHAAAASRAFETAIRLNPTHSAARIALGRLKR